MPSKSPHITASSPGPASSQSSSAGSYYSSSASSTRQNATARSASSSTKTSPATFVDTAAAHHFSPASKGITQTQEGGAEYYDQHRSRQRRHSLSRQQSGHKQPQHTFYHPSSSEPRLARPNPASLMDFRFDQAAAHPPAHQVPNSNHSGSPAMASSQAVRRYEAGWPSASTSSHHGQAYGFAEPMSVDHTAHAGMVHDFGTSPETSRGPLAKTRRTSPGGSRASGELHSTGRSDVGASAAPIRSPARHAAYDASSFSDPTARQTPSERGRAAAAEAVAYAGGGGQFPSRQGSFDPAWHAGSSHYQPAMQNGAITTASSSAKVSPRAPTADRSTQSPLAGGTTFSAPANNTAPSTPSTAARTPLLPRMNLATFPPQDLLKVLATLLHEIATANDEFRPDSSKDDGSRRSKSRGKDASGSDADLSGSRQGFSPGSHLSFTDARRPSITAAALGALATPSSTLCFHARNVPSISIESYLLRILKYCPTTNEVFLSLLVYFDRMSRMGTGAKPGANGDSEIAGEAAGLPRAAEMANRAGIPTASGASSSGASSSSASAGLGGGAETEEIYTHPGIKGFAIDSYNVHRLVIAGVTVASKFFSDVFYTNSRYAKVGGLPVHELNQLELQFLLLNDFRLTIPLDEMQRYADQLLMYGSGRPENANRVKEPSSRPGVAASPGIAADPSGVSGSREQQQQQQQQQQQAVQGTGAAADANATPGSSNQTAAGAALVDGGAVSGRPTIAQPGRDSDVDANPGAAGGQHGGAAMSAPSPRVPADAGAGSLLPSSDSGSGAPMASTAGGDASAQDVRMVDG